MKLVGHKICGNVGEGHYCKTCNRPNICNCIAERRTANYVYYYICVRYILYNQHFVATKNDDQNYRSLPESD